MDLASKMHGGDGMKRKKAIKIAKDQDIDNVILI